MATARCDGQIVTDIDGYAICQDMGGNPLAWVAVEPFSIEQIDQAEAAAHFTAGFAIFFMFWGLGYVCRAIARRVIER